MTAADIAQVRWAEDLPTMAADPDVIVAFDLADELDFCGACAEMHGGEPGQAIWRITHDRFGMTGLLTDVCSIACADEELRWLLRKDVADRVTNLTLHLPPKLAPDRLPSGPNGAAETPPPVVAPEADPLFLIYDALIRLVRELPNTATVDMSGRDGFLHAQHAVMALFAAQGINRAEQLRRDVA